MRQVIVWIDVREAQILGVDLTIRCTSKIAAAEGANSGEQTRRFFEQIAAAVETADELLVVGPSGIRDEFVKFMHSRDHGFDARILGVEAIDNPEDSRLIGYADIYFTAGGPRRSGQGSGYRETD
jgi:stalled ribosome rescue protein Dom34